MSTKLTPRVFLKHLALVGTVIAILALVSACAPAPTATPVPPTAAPKPAAPTTAPVVAPTKPAEKATITLWLPDSVRWQCTAKNLIAEFNKNSPTVNVEVSLKANYDQDNPARTALMGGAGPDIWQTDMGPAVEMGLGGFALPLNDMIKQKGWDKLFPAWVLEAATASDGKVYSLPAEMETLVLFYNKTVFEKNGWKPPKTIKEMDELAKKVQAAGLIPFASKQSAAWHMVLVLDTAGSTNVYKALKGQIPWTDPVFVKAVSWYANMVKQGYFMGSAEKMLAASNEVYLGAFAKGDAPMLWTGTWFSGQQGAYFGPQSGNQNVWDWAPFPSETGEESYAVGLGSSYAVNPKTKNPQAVAEFLNWYFSPTIQGRQFGECITPPAPVAGLTAEMMKGADPRIVAIFNALNKAFAEERYGYTTWTFFPPKTYEYLNREIQKVYVGQLTVEQYLSGLNSTFASELKAGAVPGIPARKVK